MSTSRNILRFILLSTWLIGGLWLFTQGSTPRFDTAERARVARAIYVEDDAYDNERDEQLTGTETVVPTVRHFAEVAISSDNPNSQYARWLRGEIDFELNESPLTEAQFADQQRHSLRAPVNRNVQIARERVSNAQMLQAADFESLDYTESGGSVPPDGEIAVGPDHVVAVVNVAIEIYDKSGTTLFGPTIAENLFQNSPCTGGLYDPNVLYDEEADRWIVAYDQGPASRTGGYCLLASQSGDPLGSWNEYFFGLNNNQAWMDFPTAGVGDNHIVIGGNFFRIGGNFLESRLYAFDKSDLYAGNSVTPVRQDLPAAVFTPQPLKLHGAADGTWPAYGDTHYILADENDGETARLYQWDIALNELTLVETVSIGSVTQAVTFTQADSSETMTGNDWSILDFEYRNGYGWTTSTGGCNPGGGTVNCLRWAQIDLTDGTIGPEGSGIYGSTDENRQYPNLAVNRCNDMAIGYTKATDSTFPSVYLTQRVDADPAGTLQAETAIKAGEIAYTAFDNSPHRWGDYTMMTIDPDGNTFWYMGQYSKDTGTTNGRWGMNINSFELASCTPPTAVGQVAVQAEPVRSLSAEMVAAIAILLLGSVALLRPRGR